MTRRISLVAVCCSSATRRSLLRASSSVNRRTFSMAITAWSAVNRRTFSMAITAWSAKVWSRAICLSVNGPDLESTDQDHADRLAFPQEHGHR